MNNDMDMTLYSPWAIQQFLFNPYLHSGAVNRIISLLNNVQGDEIGQRFYTQIPEGNTMGWKDRENPYAGIFARTVYRSL